MKRYDITAVSCDGCSITIQRELTPVQYDLIRSVGQQLVDEGYTIEKGLRTPFLEIKGTKYPVSVEEVEKDMLEKR